MKAAYRERGYPLPEIIDSQYFINLYRSVAKLINDKVYKVEKYSYNDSVKALEAPEGIKWDKELPEKMPNYNIEINAIQG